MPPDAVVVGSGPNGLAAAITLARAGRSVRVYEAAPTVGGGCRSAELTLPGYVHDVCSAVHALGVSSPFFRSLPLSDHGLEWVHPEQCLAHPLDDGTAALLHRSFDATVDGLGRDGPRWRRLFAPVVQHWDPLSEAVLGPLLPPRHPLTMSRFGLRALWPAARLATAAFRDDPARALFAGLAAHAVLPLERALTASVAMVLGGAAHAGGWPVARGGSQRLADALASYLASLGGEVEVGHRIASLDELPPARAVLLDVTPRQLLDLGGDRLPARYRRRLARFRYGPAVFKIDYALDGPVPWTAPGCAGAGTVHVGGTLQEVADAERQATTGQVAERPFVLFAQQSVADPTRAPAGRHTGWAYCHVPNGCTEDMTARIERQMERFAPGFTDRVLARHTMAPADLERHDENYLGGDITGGSHDGLQLLLRPFPAVVPYATPAEGVYLCSSSTPPGAGVHGMCGYHAASAALRSALR